jgi:putative FmdB family regulatory protein
MPVYEFECAECGAFTQFRNLNDSNRPAECPECLEPSPRVFSVIHLRSMRAPNRIAHERNERSAHAPHVCGTGCSHTHARPNARAKKPSDKPALQYSAKPNSRPWMLGH